MKRWCWYCKHSGERFRLQPGNEGHVHCVHPDDPDVKDIAACKPVSCWATLRRCFWTCDKWEAEKAFLISGMNRPNATGKATP